MKLCPRCMVRTISPESEACRPCRDEMEPLLRGGWPSRFTCGAVLELLAEGINVPALLYGHLRLVRARWREEREAAVEDFRREHGAALAARRYLEARDRGEKLTAREAGSPWRVKAPAVRMRASRLRRNAARVAATGKSAAGSPPSS